jgi:predicted nucleotidyltransferase
MMSRVKEILRRKKERKSRLEAALHSIEGQLKSTGALKIILFGSLVKGDVDIHSDLDLLVIMPATKSGKEWTRLIYETVEREIASEIIVYNRKEFDEKLPTSSFLRNVLNTGRVVYEKTP